MRYCPIALAYMFRPSPNVQLVADALRPAFGLAPRDVDLLIERHAQLFGEDQPLRVQAMTARSALWLLRRL